MKNADYLLTLQKLVSNSELSEADQKRLLEYTAYLIEIEETKNVGKAYGWLKKQYKMKELEIKELQHTIEEMKNVF